MRPVTYFTVSRKTGGGRFLNPAHVSQIRLTGSRAIREFRHWQRYLALILTLILWENVLLLAQFAPAANLNTVTITVGAFTCKTSAGTGVSSVNSWNWGAQNSSTVSAGGGLTGKLTFENLNFTKSLDECSGPFAQAASGGTHLSTVTLRFYDKNSKVVQTVVLSTVVVTFYQISGNNSLGLPQEQISLEMGKVQITNQTTSPGSTFCWDTIQNKSC